MILALVTLLPLAGACLLCLVPKEETGLHRGLGFVTTLATLIASLMVLPGFQPATWNAVVDWVWAESLGIQFIGADSGTIVVFLLLLATLALRPRGLAAGAQH